MRFQCMLRASIPPNTNYRCQMVRMGRLLIEDLPYPTVTFLDIYFRYILATRLFIISFIFMVARRQLIAFWITARENQLILKSMIFNFLQCKLTPTKLTTKKKHRHLDETIKTLMPEICTFAGCVVSLFIISQGLFIISSCTVECFFLI